MTDIEFEILDELYFVKTIQELCHILALEEAILVKEIGSLLEKKWVKILDLADHEIEITIEEYLSNYNQYRFNITKKGLIAHNQV